jgi:hypothetical protein
MPYRAGFQRDSSTAETATLASTPVDSDRMQNGFLRTQTGALRITGTAAAAIMRSGFLRAPSALAEPGMGALVAVIDPAPASCFWQCGFKRILVDTGGGAMQPALAWTATTAAEAMRQGFMRSPDDFVVLG